MPETLTDRALQVLDALKALHAALPEGAELVPAGDRTQEGYPTVAFIERLMPDDFGVTATERTDAWDVFVEHLRHDAAEGDQDDGETSPSDQGAIPQNSDPEILITANRVASPADDQDEADKAEAPFLDAERLRGLAGRIHREIGTTYGEFDALVERLAEEEGLDIDQEELGEGVFTLSMAGLRASSRSDARTALINWGNAARRRLLELGA